MLKIQTKNMTEGKPVRLMVSFALPLMLANILQVMYNVVDSAIIGRLLGVSAAASAGAAGVLFWMALSSVFGLTHGFGILFAQRFGAGDNDSLRKSFKTSIVLSVIFSIILALTGIFLSRPTLRMLGTPPELIDNAVIYLQVFFIGAPIIFFYNLFGGMLRAMGDSKTPLHAMVLATVLNIVLDFVLIIPFGIAGISAATLIAQFTAAVYCFIVLKRTGFLAGESFRFDTDTAKELLRLGLPLSIRNAVIEVGSLIVQRYINGYGVEFIAGIAVSRRMYSLLLVAGGAVEAAVATFVAQNFGAKQFDRVRRGVKDGLLMMMISIFSVITITIPFARSIIGLFFDGDPAQVVAVIDVGATQLTIVSTLLPIMGVLFLYRSALQGIGNTLIPMISGILEMLTRIIMVIFMTPFWNEWAIYLSDPAGWIFAVILLTVSYTIFSRKLPASTIHTEGSEESP